MKARDGGSVEWEYKFKCKGRCKGEFTADVDDVEVGYFGGNYGGDHQYRGYYIRCQRCGTIRELDKNNLPQAVRQKADDKEAQRKDR